MNLQEKRAEWERNQFPVLIVSQTLSGYPIVYIVLETDSRDFRLHRYFPTGIGTPNCNWEVSVDKSGSLVECLEVLNEKLRPFNKEVEQADWKELNNNPLVGISVKNS